MNSSSDGEYSEMEIEDNGEWKKVRSKRKRNRDPNSPTTLNPNKRLSTSASQSSQTRIEFPLIADKTHMSSRRNYQPAGGNLGEYISDINYKHTGITQT